MERRRRSSLSGGYSETKVFVLINLNVNLKPDTDSLIGKLLGPFGSTFLFLLLDIDLNFVLLGDRIIIQDNVKNSASSPLFP